MQINNVQDLDIAIASLEHKKLSQEKLLRQEFVETINSFKPVNIIKAAYKNATETGTLGSTLLKAAASVGITTWGSKLLDSNSLLLGKLAGSALNNVANNDFFNNTNKIMAWGKAIVGNLFRKK